ncbi:MAG: hypothetical protein LBT62_03500, partial [Deltaproteobacteria bacterium]|nr:hypothetical protein [Deltaproteobacteria bacterium]
MLRVINAALVWLAALAVGFSLTAGVANADGEELLAKKEQYESEPFLRFIPSIPQVMMIVERDWKIYYPAYNNLSDLNGDGSIDIGFNPSITYVGYYDINSCYSHDGSKFYRVGPTTPHTQAQADSERPADLKANIPSPASAHGICTATSTDGKSPGTWHGNWLNFALTSRIDAIRKVLYGGKRSTDTAASGATPSLTILEPSYVPSNAFVFGAEVISDDLWNTHSPDSTYFRSDYYTALPRPTGKYMHFFARVDHTPYGAHVARSANPLLRILYNVDSTYPHPVSQNKVRYWDWIYGANILPDDTNMPVNNTAKGYTAPTKMALTARVQVCNPATYSETEGCARYGNSVKPIGLIQQYGERNSMQFGLITAQMSRTNCTGGTLTVYDSRCNDHGGLLRHHIDKVLGVSVNPDTGQIVAGQLLDTLSKFELADYVDASQQYHFNSSVNTGNPVGEMAMEALRYLSGATSGLPAYGLVGTEMLGLTRANWANRPASTVTCVKPFVLVISDVYPTYDGNDIPSATQLSAPILTGLNGLITFNWDMAQLLEDVTKNEGYRTSGHQYYYPKTDENFANRGLCVAKNFNSSLSLSNIRGFCPSEPSLSGSYSLVAAAYYGRTHDFTLDDRNTPAEFFVVGLSPNIPQVSIADGRGHQANIMPIVVVAPSNSGNVTGDNVVHVDSFPHTRTLINFIMKRAQADKNGYTFRLEYMTNFESAAEPYDIWERDHLNNADVALLTDAATPEIYRETTPYYINSGPFKTTQDIINSDYTRVVIGPGPYYAFKSSENPNDPTDITQWNVVGIVIVTNSVGSDTSWSSSIGYTINGVVHSGAYLEASSHGNDFRVPTTSNVYPFQTPNDTLQRRTGVPKGNGALGGGGWPGPHLHIPSIVVDPLLTPWECAYAGDTSASGAANCGHGNGSYPTSWNNIYSWASNSSKATVAKKMRYIQVRSFEFAEPSANQPLNLPNPLWLAAKYGGYKDLNGNGKPDPGEWDTLKPGSPDN